MSLIQPVFVTYDENEREAYLSQLGNFSPVERSIFHKLCRLWEPLISYNRFISMVNRDTANANAELMRLMAKLSKSHMGIISTALKDGERKQEGIVLCEPGQQIFYSYQLEEEITDAFENLHKMLPTVRSLREKGTPIPDEHIKAYTYKQAAELYINKKTNGGEIISLANGADDKFLLTRATIVRCLSIAISKMRSFFQSSNFLALGGSVLEMSLAELKNKIAAKNPVFWKELAGKFLEQKGDLLAQRKVKIPDDLFDVCRFLSEFLSAQIEAAREKKARDEEKRADMAALADTIRDADNFLVPEELFDKHFETFQEKYGEHFKTFRREFEKAYLEAENGRNLPVILKLEGSFIHEDNIKALFLQRVDKISRELYKHYLPLMSRYVKYNRSDISNIFNSNATFEADIEDQVKSRDRLTAHLLGKPATVAEALIQSARKTRAVSTVDEMKAVLVSFFYPEEIQFKELQIIFNLSAGDLYRHAFLNFGIIRQLILRITGRHESYQKKFSEQSQMIYQKMQNGSALPADFRGSLQSKNKRRRQAPSPSRTLSPQAGSSRRLSQRSAASSAGKGKTNSSGKSSELSPNGDQIVKKMYSAQERDSAWQEFSKSLRK